MEGNFHGRTTTIVSFSDDSDATAGYAPYTPGFRMVPYGDIAAIRAAIDDTTVAVLLEPIQGEGGVIIPPEGFLREVRALCDETDVLMVADEIQSGLGRSGRTFACDHEGVVPDIYILGKALGGGLYPVSAIAADHDVLDVITPGSHGSTFGGNPLAAAIGREVVAMLQTGEFQERAVVARRAARRRPRPTWSARLRRRPHPRPVVRHRHHRRQDATGREVTEALLARASSPRRPTARPSASPRPLVASEDDIDLLVAAFRAVMAVVQQLSELG